MRIMAGNDAAYYKKAKDGGLNICDFKCGQSTFSFQQNLLLNVIA